MNAHVSVSDPKADLAALVGDVSGIELSHNQVFVAIYQRPEKTSGGLYLPETVRAEDAYQSKVGLILRAGPSAFQDATGNWKWPENIGLNDWIFFRASDGWGMQIKGHMCRLLDDTRVRGRITHPDLIW